MFGGPIIEEQSNHPPVIDYTKVSPQAFSKKVFTDLMVTETFSVRGAVDDPDGDIINYYWFIDYDSKDPKNAFMSGTAEAEMDKVDIKICKFKELGKGKFQLMLLITDGAYLFTEKGFEIKNGDMRIITWTLDFQKECTE